MVYAVKGTRYVAQPGFIFEKGNERCIVNFGNVRGFKINFKPINDLFWRFTKKSLF